MGDAVEPPAIPQIIADGGSLEEAKVCRSLVGKALTSCPKVRFLVSALEGLGVPSAELVHCVHCPDDTAVAGGYMPAQRAVLLCQQWVAKEKGEVNNTLVHEMVHAYDDARAFMDWTNLTHHACTEIRAANLSGDCSFLREVDRGNVSPVNFAAAGERCVRRRAELSVAMSCGDAAVAAAAVDRAWKVCYKDYAPFDRPA